MCNQTRRACAKRAPANAAALPLFPPSPPFLPLSPPRPPRLPSRAGGLQTAYYSLTSRICTSAACLRYPAAPSPLL
eukprot:356244-Chlamydomonas_euryale.AAC.15